MVPLLPVFPLLKPISFLPQGKYAQAGRPEEAITCNHYAKSQQPIWDRLDDARVRVTEAKRKFTDVASTEELKKKWKKWDEATFDSYRLQFRVIDLNEDGLIDFHELCHVLDEIGDTSTIEERRRFFHEVDVDRSDGVDFEEFLELIDRVETGLAGSIDSIGRVCLSTQSDVQDVMQIGQLSLKQQIQNGLF